MERIERITNTLEEVISEMRRLAIAHKRDTFAPTTLVAEWFIERFNEVLTDVKELEKIANYNESLTALKDSLKDDSPLEEEKKEEGITNYTSIVDKTKRLKKVEAPQPKKILGYTHTNDIEKRLKEVNAPKNDVVNHPAHYCKGKYQCIDVMLEVFGLEKVLAFCELNAFKYQWRADSKGNDIQDKKKAIWYNNKYIELKENEQ